MRTASTDCGVVVSCVTRHRERVGQVSCAVFKQKVVMFVLPIICTCPSQILLAVCRVYTGCQCIYVCVIAYCVMSSVNTESLPASVC